MSLTGADLVGLDRLGTDFGRWALELDRLNDTATRGAQELQGRWEGPDAAEFAQVWLSRHRPVLALAVADLGRAAETIERNRRAQEETSAADLVGGSGPGGSLNGGGSGNGSDSDSGDDFGGDGGKKLTDNVRIVGWTPDGSDLFASPDGSENEIHANDIDQNSLGDCYFVAALAGLADQDPDLIRNAIVDHGDGTYTVTLWEKVDGEYRAVEVTVTNEFPVTEKWNDTDKMWEETSGYTAGEADGELWPRIFEKAYAQHLGDGDLVAGYQEIIGGDGAEALEVLTGVDSQTVDTDAFSIEELDAMHGDGVLLPASHRDRPDAGWWDKMFGDSTGWYDAGSDEVVTRHQYWIEDIDVEGDMVVVRNPWAYENGDKLLIELTYDEFVDAFREIDYSPVD